MLYLVRLHVWMPYLDPFISISEINLGNEAFLSNRKCIIAEGVVPALARSGIIAEESCLPWEDLELLQKES